MARNRSTQQKQARRAARRFPRRRRAMVLLVVLSLLAIFTLITVSFVLLSSQHRVTATAAAKMNQRGDEPRSLVYDALLTLVRGSNSGPLQGQGLLEDMYGNDSVTGAFTAVPTSVTAVLNGPVQAATVAFDPQYNVPVPAANQPNNPLDPFVMSARLYQDGSFNGCVITMTSGHLAGRSSRVVEYLANNGNFTLQVASFADSLPPQIGDRFVINGRPFNGTGFGLRPRAYNFAASRGIGVGADTLGSKLLNEPLLNQVDNDPLLPASSSIHWLRALLPNHAFAFPEASYSSISSNAQGVMQFDPAGPGGADEPYDAPDYQNPHLAMHYWDPSVNGMVTRLPSFHRPDLLNWWSYQLSNPANSQPYQFDNISAFDAVTLMSPSANDQHLATVLRKALYRPYPLDHPNFPGNSAANAPFHPLWGYGTQANPEWDVDNDGDGRRDSIWIDLGLPAQAAPDGRWYKPMFAILCVDMDGKLNLNAHGNANHIDTANFQPSATAAVPAAPLAGPFPGATPGSVPVGSFFFGQGYGPAEVNLRRVLPINTAIPGLDPYRFLLEGRTLGGGKLEGRYGEGFGEGPGFNAAVPRAGFTGDTVRMSEGYPYAGMSGDPRLVMANMSQDQMPYSYSMDAFVTPSGSPSWVINGYGTDPDLDGDGVLLLDHRGVPYVASIASSPGHGVHGFGEPGETLNDPYEVDLTRTYGTRSRAQGSNAPASPTDAPFTPEELEQLLRHYDADTDNLSSGSGSIMPAEQTRLSGLLHEAFLARPQLASMVTTESWDLPVATISVNIDNVRAGGVTGANYPVRRLQAQTIQDQLAARLRVGNPTITPAAINTAVRNLLPPELLAGRKMDLNRVFGNGRDDNGNGVVDEPIEGDLERLVAPDRAWTNSPKLAWFDPDNDGDGISPNTHAGTIANSTGGTPRQSTDSDLGDSKARLQYAKHLYILMMLLIDEDFRNTSWLDPRDTLPPAIAHQREVAKRVAQWAVNVVDFRDRDSIITGFEYDVRPFEDDSTNPDGNPWDVDGIIERTGVTPPPMEASHGAANSARAVVWGCERPDLLITEAIASHDRRTSDESPGGLTSDQTGADTDYDLVGRPRGQLVVELHNPWGTFSAAAPELQARSPVNGEWGVKLNAVSSMNNPSTNRPSPVWRIATRKPDLRSGSRPQPLTQPEHYDPVLKPADIDRIVYFTNTNEAETPPSAGSETFNRLGGALHPLLATLDVVRPGGYALIGPGGRTDSKFDLDLNGQAYRVYFGARDTTQDNATSKKNLYPYFVQLAGPPGPVNGHRVGPFRRRNATSQYDFDLPASVPPVVGVVIGPHVNGNKMLNMSISEPDGGYDISAADPADPVNRTNPNAFFPTPVDDISSPPYNDDLVTDGFVPEADSMIYLERLADPTRYYDPDANPYITIDRMFVGVRSYRGEPNPTEARATGEYGGPVRPDNGRGLDSFRRGTDSNSGGQDREAPRNIWSPWTSPQATSDITTGPLEIRPGMPTSYPLQWSSFGGLNGGYNGPSGPDRRQGGPMEFGRAIYDNAAPTGSGSGAQPNVMPDKYNGAGQYSAATPLPPWLTWNNRPFVSPVELLLVPATSQPGLLLQHGVRDKTGSSYDSNDNTTDRQSAFRDSFRHLLNFFNASRRSGSAGASNPRGQAAELFRLFDYVEVPSRFTGTDTYLDSQEFSGGNTHYLHPPYNKLFRWREPGKINLNTVYDPLAPLPGTVWDALSDGAFRNPGTWSEVAMSRQGYTGGYGFNRNYPTMFANPFRAAGMNPFVPLQSLMQLKDVDVTMLRQKLNTTGSLEEPLFAETLQVGPYNDPDRNPYFRYAGLQKIFNNVTTRSNVYAIWITVGYFEVTPAPYGIDAGHPDGWQLGPEVGADTGEIQRHRGFFLYDRTIPVGFQRGENLNVEDGLLIQRYIE